MLEVWSAPFLGTKARRFYVKLLVVVGCLALLVSSSDQETNLVLQIAFEFICAFKKILSDLASFIKVVVLDV
jgi:hypothetical protein